ncbi:MAG: hypothetical protein K2I00_05910 [Ruminococcus sp.]|nr:hypothetical protein [Ruminococcus sp.]
MGIKEFILILVAVLVAVGVGFYINMRYFISKSEYAKIRNELKDIKKRSENMESDTKDGVSGAELEKLVKDVEVNRRKVQAVVLKLEEFIETTTTEITDVEIKQELKDLRSDTDEIQQKITSLEKLADSYGGYQKLEQAIRMLTDATQIHKNKIEEQQNGITSLRIENQNLREEIGKLAPKVEKIEDDNIDIPDIQVAEPEIEGIKINEEYIDNLAESIGDIKDVISSYDYNQFKKIIKNIIDDDDYDDSGSIMRSVNSAIQKYIYNINKVSADDFGRIKAFVEKAGYSRSEIAEGDSIMHNSRYFEYMGGNTKYSDPSLKGTICRIDVEPYVLVYSDNGTNEEAVLKGECICYK